MILNLGSSSVGFVLTVITNVGATVTVSKAGSRVYTKTADAYGTASFKNLSRGTWTITLSNGSDSFSKTVELTGDCTVKYPLNTLPTFTYDGTYEIVDDEDTAIDNSTGNWKIRFLTSGTLNFTELNGAADGIDVFVVGGGAGGDRGGGGGGYTGIATVTPEVGVDYPIVVGAGGGKHADGGSSSAFGFSVEGGKTPTATYAGGNGGSGGGAYYGDGSGGAGGSDGSDGVSTKNPGGTGQGTTTREFHESGATLYAGGGGGGTPSGRTPGSGGAGGGAAGTAGNYGTGNSATTPNTGGGGGGGANGGGYGASGIVIIRNAR